MIEALIALTIITYIGLVASMFKIATLEEKIQEIRSELQNSYIKNGFTYKLDYNGEKCVNTAWEFMDAYEKYWIDMEEKRKFTRLMNLWDAKKRMDSMVEGGKLVGKMCKPADPNLLGDIKDAVQNVKGVREAEEKEHEALVNCIIADFSNNREGYGGQKSTYEKGVEVHKRENKGV